MSEYKGVTSTIVELLSRKKIQAVPRNRDTKRTEQDNVGRPDDDRKNSEVPTRQQSIQKQIIDEDKLKKGDRVLHVGGWPGMIAGPQHKWKPPKGTITGTGKHKGELVHSIKVDGKDIENWGHPHDFKKIHEQGIQSIATEPGKEFEPNKGKRPKKLEIQDVGKQPPTKVEVNPEIDNTPNIFSSKEETGKLVEGEWKPPDMKAIKARREAEHVAKFASSLKSFGGFKVTGELTPEHIRKGAEIRARLNKLKEATNQYNNVSIQYQTRGGTWITARKTSNDPADIMLAMRNVQKVYSQNRVRAIGARGMVLDFQPIDPSDIAVEETKPKEKFIENPKGKINKQNTGWKSRMAWIKDDKGKVTAKGMSDWWKSGYKSYHNAKNKKPLPEENLDELSKETIKGFWKDKNLTVKKFNKRAKKDREEELDKREQQTEGKSYDVPKRLQAGKKDATEWRGGGVAQPIIKAAKVIYDKVKSKKANEGEEYTGSMLPIKIDKAGKRSPAVPKNVSGPVEYTKDVMQGKTDPKWPENTGKNLGMAAIAGTSAMPPFKAASGAYAPEPVAAFQILGYGGKSAEKKDSKKLTGQDLAKYRGGVLSHTEYEGQLIEGTQVSPGVQTIERTLRKILEARHAGIETDEPKFSQSIQKVAAHAKTYTDVEHTYKHADGSKTRVDQELGEKIHRTIHSTPHRHRADLIQKMHKSAAHLKDALGEKK